MPNQHQQILELEGLSVSYGGVQAVSELSLVLRQGEVVGLVGESGSGKTTVLRAIAGLLGRGGKVSGGSIRFQGQDITGLSPKEYSALRGAGISYVFQDPVASLDPLYTVGEQFDECIRAHRQMDKAEMRQLEERLLREMGFSDPDRVLGSRPGQLSGGMCQRVVLAFGLACGPVLLLADEPTSALDVSVQAQVLESLLRIRDELGVTVLLVTHNMGVIAQVADRVGVMYKGSLVELGEKDQVLKAPVHPYTQALIAAVPRADGSLPKASAEFSFAERSR